MAEENQVTKEPQQVQQEPQRVTMKDPKKVEAGKRLAAINHEKREEVQNSRVSQYYGIGAVLAVGVIGGLGYYIYQTKKGQATADHRAGSKDQQGGEVPNNPPKPRPQNSKFDMD